MPKIKDEYDVGAAFARIENELMSSMIRNMERHKVEEISEDKEWEMWQALQLKSLDKYKKDNAKKYGTQFQDINKRIGNILTRMNKDGQMDQERKILKAIKNGADMTKASDTLSGRFFEVNDRKMDALIKATTGEIRKAETAVLRKADDVYRKTIFNAQVYANSGAGTYEKAVDMATKDFMAAGLNCVEYKNGARHTLSDYADMAVRTAAKRAYLQGEGTKRKEWGIHTVIVNQRSDTGAGGVCPECLPFVGKVFIDDVWSGGKEGEKDEKGEELPLLSDAIAAGLYHPRCRDSHTTYFPGISTPPSGKITKKDIKEAVETEKEEAKQQYAERQAEKYERLADTRLDPENKQKYEAWAEECKDKAELRKILTERRKQRMAERARLQEEQSGQIQYNDRIREDTRSLIESLSNEYNTRLKNVTVGAENAAGDVDMIGARMRINNQKPELVIHEFAHTLANSSADRYGLTHDNEFWKEIKQLRQEHRKAVHADSSKWISIYGDGDKKIDEWMADAFTQAKLRELELPIPEHLNSNDFTYSQRVLDTVNKYFGKETYYLRNDYPRGFKDTRKIENPISDEQLQAFIEKANSKGIRIGSNPGSTGNFELYCGDPAVLHDVLEHIDINMKEAKEAGLLKKDDDIILVYDNVLGYKDNRSVVDIEGFAQTKGKIITLNKYMYDDTKNLKDQYEEAVNCGVFAKGTTYKNVIDHELGHIIDKKNRNLRIKILGVLKKEASDVNISLDEYIVSHISSYAIATNENGEKLYDELISELYSMKNGEESSFALKLLERVGVQL